MESMKEIIANLKKLSLVQIGVIGAVLIAALFFFLFNEPKKVEPIQTVEPLNEKGFELFDNNTWFKGEKELQVLELRALKGQIEKDLLNFEKIKKANVLLDIQPPRSLQKTKASVILTLKEGLCLSQSEIAAIALHVSCGVKGLDPERVVLSDTGGRLYQGSENSALIELEETRANVGALLKASIGQDHFVRLSNSFAIDSSVASSALKEELSHQFPKIVFQYIPFRKKHVQALSRPSSSNFNWLFLTAIGLLVLSTIFFFKHREKRSDDLTHALKKQSPEMIAELLSYTKPEKAKEIILRLPEEMQEKVFESISQLEKTL